MNLDDTFWATDYFAMKTAAPYDDGYGDGTGMTPRDRDRFIRRQVAMSRGSTASDEVRMEQHNRSMQALDTSMHPLLGAAVGMPVGAAIGSIWTDPEKTKKDEFQWGPVVGAGLGAAAGTGLGFLSQRYANRPLPDPRLG